MKSHTDLSLNVTQTLMGIAPQPVVHNVTGTARREAVVDRESVPHKTHAMRCYQKICMDIQTVY